MNWKIRQQNPSSYNNLLLRKANKYDQPKLFECIVVENRPKNVSFKNAELLKYLFCLFWGHVFGGIFQRIKWCEDSYRCQTPKKKWTLNMPGDKLWYELWPSELRNIWPYGIHRSFMDQNNVWALPIRAIKIEINLNWAWLIAFYYKCCSIFRKIFW